MRRVPDYFDSELPNIAEKAQARSTLSSYRQCPVESQLYA